MDAKLSMAKAGGKRKRGAGKQAAGDATQKKAKKVFRNKEKTLVFCSRGVLTKTRHLMLDLQTLLPHHKKESKMDSKDKLDVVNEVAELRGCSSTLFFECRKRKDSYLWMAKTPSGPSVKFEVLNIHTMDALKMTGNCMRGTRPLLCFDEAFDAEPHWELIRELLTQTFGTPRNHPKSKAFIDHVFSFHIADGKVWFRNFQIVTDTVKNKKSRKLMEIGPRFVLNPIRIFAGSFGGPTLYQNPRYVSPNALRARRREMSALKHRGRVFSMKKRQAHVAEHKGAVHDMDRVFGANAASDSEGESEGESESAE